MTLSKEVREIFFSENDTIKFKYLLSKIQEKGFGVLLVILSLPSALPIPAPGYSTPFGIALILLAWQIIQDRKFPWFPEKFLNKEIKTKKSRKLIKIMTQFLAFFEKFLRPRFPMIYKNFFFKRFLGYFVLLCSFSMLIPIPLTNTLPAFGIFLIGLGMLEEDGLFSLLGIFVSILGLTLIGIILFLVGFYGLEGVDLIKNWILGLVNL